MRVTAREAELVRESCAALAASPRDSGRAFYDHLFSLDPSLRALFVADPDRQAEKLIATLRAVVDGVERWVEVAPSLEELAVRHLAYGVRAEHYAPLGEALAATLRSRLGADCSDEIVAAWARVYGAIEAQMLAAAYPERDRGAGAA